jgi:hypothetical protein
LRERCRFRSLATRLARRIPFTPCSSRAYTAWRIIAGTRTCCGYDIRLLAESLSDGGAAEFIALATERRVAAVCADGLVRAVRVVDARLPAPLRSWIEYAPWRDAGEPSAAFLDHDRQVDKLVSDLRALPTLSMRARLVWQHLFPRPEYMLRHYSVRSRVWLPYLYLKRIVAGAPRWLHR